MNNDNKAVKLGKNIFKQTFIADRALWIVVAMLSIISVFVIYSSTGSMAYHRAGGNTSFYIVKQFFIMLFSFVAIWVIQLFKVKYYRILANIIFLGCLLLQVLTFFMGTEFNEASRWIEVAGTGFTVQPSDFLRVALVMLMAKILSKRGDDLAEMRIIPLIRTKTSIKIGLTNYDILMQNTLPVLLGMTLTCGLIFYSDFSTSALTFLTSFTILYLSGIKFSELFKLIAIIVLGGALLIAVMNAAGVGRATSVVSRLETFFASEQQIESGDVDNYQAEQARIAVASGGILGKGPGNSTQRANLPHSYSDFAFAFIVEEYGLWGATLVLLLYVWMLFRAKYIAQRCDDEFSRLLVLGLAVMIVFQALFNILVSVQIFPVTGQPLPLISLGGSSVLSTCLALGMIFGVSRQLNIKRLRDEKNNS